MTLLQVHYFLRVAECMSFSEAARQLYVSQPSISKQVQALEKELGMALFDRSVRNRLNLTPAGIVFRDSFLRWTRQFEETKLTAAAAGKPENLLLTIGIGQGWDMTDALLRFQHFASAQNSGVQFRFESDTFQILQKKVRSGELDVIVCTKTSLNDFNDIEIREIAGLETRAYVRKGLFCPENRALTVKDFEGRRLMVLPPDEAPMAEDIIMLQFLARQVRPLPEVYPNRDAIQQGLLLGKGFAVYDQYVYFRNDPRLTWFKLEEKIPVCIVWRKTNSNPLIKLFAERMFFELQN